MRLRSCRNCLAVVTTLLCLAGCATPQSVDQLNTRLGPIVSGQIARLRANMARPHLFVVFEGPVGYVQCMPNKQQKAAIYCEVQSAESWEGLAPILTPIRVELLHKLGYADPEGNVPNYWKSYPAAQYNDDALAREIIMILHDVYGYSGTRRLKIRAT